MIGNRGAVILGFDPGGLKQFGWCVAQATSNGHLRLRASGRADNAEDAIKAALRQAGPFGPVGAAGIDSPLFWVAKGGRKADKSIRSAMKQLGARNIGGTVQQVNSLRGACLIQGIMAAHLLRSEIPEIRITESHPKALLWLLQVARVDHRVPEIRISDLSELIDSELLNCSDHERDAALGAVAALAMIDKRSGWRDLYPEEENPFTPVSPVEYWMPVDVPT